MRYLILLLFINYLYAFDIKTVDDTVKRDPNKIQIAKDGKPIYPAMKVPVVPAKTIMVQAMKVPIIYAIGDKPKTKIVKKTIKTKPIDKSKYFTDKKLLRVRKIKQEEIKIDNGVKFFETINKKDNAPVDIEK